MRPISSALRAVFQNLNSSNEPLSLPAPAYADGKTPPTANLLGAVSRAPILPCIFLDVNSPGAVLLMPVIVSFSSPLTYSLISSFGVVAVSIFFNTNA